MVGERGRWSNTGSCSEKGRRTRISSVVNIQIQEYCIRVTTEYVTAVEPHSASSDGRTLRLEVSLGSASFTAEGHGASVLQAFAAFREFYETNQAYIPPLDLPGSIEPTTDETAAGRSDAPPESLSRGASNGPVPLPVFLSSKKLPRGNHAIALGIAVWAKRFRDEQIITADSAKAHWRNSGKKVPANIARDLGSAASMGWLERLAGTTGNYSLTTYGETVFDGFSASE